MANSFMKKQGFHLLKYERCGKSVRAYRCILLKAVEKLRKCSGLVIYSCFKDSVFTAVKGMQSFKLGML